MTIGVHVERCTHHGLVEHKERARDVLAVFAINGTGFGPKIRVGIGEISEAVAFEIHDEREVLCRNRKMVGREIVGRVGIPACADAREDLVVLGGRIALGAAEHHMLEEVRKPGAPGLELVT
jgi:hypothetical protein